MFRFAALALVTSVAFAAPLQFHVSPTGDDSASGSSDKPFATVQTAINVARKARHAEGATILVHDGTYALQQPLTIVSADPADAGMKITIAAAPNARPLITGGRK